MGFTGSPRNSSISMRRVTFEIEMTKGMNQNCPHRHDGVSDSAVYEFDLQRSSGNAARRLYMSWKFAV
jgi:hypothetical protein